jgi:hypothetical protein
MSNVSLEEAEELVQRLDAIKARAETQRVCDELKALFRMNSLPETECDFKEIVSMVLLAQQRVAVRHQ